MKRMKILQLCKKFPYPLKDGESVAVTFLSSAMHELGVEIDLLAMNTTKHYFDMDLLPNTFNHYENIHVVPFDNKLKIKDAFLNLFSNKSFHISRYDLPVFREKIKKLLEKKRYDIVQLETLNLSPYIETIRKYSDAKIVMRSHNVEHEIWERITENTSFGLKKMYLKLLTKRLKAYELSRMNAYDLLIAITQRDLDKFVQLGSTIPAIDGPIGLDFDQYSIPPDVEKPKKTISFIGSLDWMPNLEGLSWFIDTVWPIIQRKDPGIEFHIAGRNSPDWLKSDPTKKIVVHGEVEEARAFILAHPMMVVPLLSGSGMRVKILESMALARATISTSIGLEGIPAIDGKSVFIADEPDMFAQKVLDYFETDYEKNEIGLAARTFVKSNFDNKLIAQRILASYQKLIAS